MAYPKSPYPQPDTNPAASGGKGSGNSAAPDSYYRSDGGPGIIEDSSDHDGDDTTPDVPAGATGTAGVPARCPDLVPTADSSTNGQPRATAPAYSSTAAQPRPEDFM